MTRIMPSFGAALSFQLKTKNRKSSIQVIRIRLSCAFVRLEGLKSCLKRYFEIRE